MVATSWLSNWLLALTALIRNIRGPSVLARPPSVLVLEDKKQKRGKVSL